MTKKKTWNTAWNMARTRTTTRTMATGLICHPEDTMEKKTEAIKEEVKVSMVEADPEGTSKPHDIGMGWVKVVQINVLRHPCHHAVLPCETLGVVVVVVVVVGWVLEGKRPILKRTFWERNVKHSNG